MNGRVKIYRTHHWGETGMWFGWICPACQIPQESMRWDYAHNDAAEHWRTCPALRLERLLDELRDRANTLGRTATSLRRIPFSTLEYTEGIREERHENAVYLRELLVRHGAQT
jgi:hypothetical protein